MYDLVKPNGEIFASSETPWFLSESMFCWDTEGRRVMDHDRALSQVYTGEGEPEAFVAGWTLPAPVYLPLTKLQFLEHLQSAGGITDAQLVEAKAAPALGALWLKLDYASDVRRDYPTTINGLDALVALGYLTETTRAAVLDGWPT
ncbi:hypothetical protein [Caenispirillum bisanense]|uniref:hypothetical protein n=1 Tax=Caenispirillum bisanense TaxID=414052 RepID=UPI0011412B1C|nr:hypothetical protein [Caenispirillum bisanense]